MRTYGCDFRVLDGEGKVLARHRNLKSLQQQLQPTLQETLKATAGDDIEQTGLTDWTFGPAPQAVEKQQGRFAIKAYQP